MKRRRGFLQRLIYSVITCFVFIVCGASAYGQTLSDKQKQLLDQFAIVVEDPRALLEWSPEKRIENCRSLFAEAAVLGESNGQELIAILLASLDAPERSVFFPASYLLRFVTQENFGYHAFGTDEERKSASLRWKKWWEQNRNRWVGKIPKLAHSTLIADEIPGRVNGKDSDPPGRVIHLNAAGETLWETTKFLMPYDVAPQADGSYWVNLIRERAVWQIMPNEAGGRKQEVGGYPCSLQLLDNGHLLVAGWDDDVPGFVREYNQAGELVWQLEDLRWPWKAERLKNGNTLIADAGTNRVFEVDSQGNEVWAVDQLGPETPELFDALGPVYCQRLADGNTLVSIRGLSKIVELDPQGKVVWEVDKKLLLNQYAAVRLWNGNTLICDAGHFRVIELDVDKNIVWEKGGLGYPAKAYRY